MTTDEIIRTGYHIRVRHRPWTLITIHAPTTNWQHRPGESAPKNGFWVGPIASKERAAQVAEDLAEKLGYAIELCGICFHDRRPTPPTRGEGPGGPTTRRRRQRTYEPARVGNRRKSGGVSSRSVSERGLRPLPMQTRFVAVLTPHPYPLPLSSAYVNPVWILFSPLLILLLTIAAVQIPEHCYPR